MTRQALLGLTLAVSIATRALISCCALARAQYFVKIPIVRNSRREAGCAQRDTRFWARNIFRRRPKKFARLFFALGAEKKIGPFFSTSSEVIFFFWKLIRVYVVCATWKRHKRLGIGNVTDHRLWRMANIVLICFFLSIDLGSEMLAPSYS